MRIIIAGGSGFLGRALTRSLLAAGHAVVVLTRGPGRREAAGPSFATWTPDGETGAWADALDGADAVVNLAGDSIDGGRWTDARKAAILESRVLATRSLVSATRSRERPPGVFVSASAQGYYGSRGDDELAEDQPPGADFLAGVCRAWEEEAGKVGSAARLVLLRTSLVLSGAGGALPRMVLPYRFFAGGHLGTGKQFVSWVHLDDWVGMARWALEDGRVSGALNVCAPAAVRNRDFSAALGRALGRPSWIPAPAFMLRAALGEMADALLLSSVRMTPARATELGYRFRFADLDAALHELLDARG